MKTQAKSVTDQKGLDLYIEEYFQYLSSLEQIVDPVLNRVHQKSGLVWRGRKEVAGLLEEKDILIKSETCNYFDGDLD